MCDICGMTPCMMRCPNYRPPKSTYYCSICDEGIFENEEYVESMEGDYAHYDCLTGLATNQMIRWTGCSIKVMGED